VKARRIFWCLVIAGSCFIAGTFATPIGPIVLTIPLSYIGYTLACTPLTSQPCMVCGRKPAFMMPKRTTIPWWHMGLHRSDVSWVCDEDLDTFIRLIIKTGPPA
jgi:hypothetical protein